MKFKKNCRKQELRQKHAKIVTSYIVYGATVHNVKL